MAQHFLLTRHAKSMTLGQIMTMTDQQAEDMFRSLRWEGGKAHCPRCGGVDPYEDRRPSGALRFRCKACKAGFSSCHRGAVANR
jgi:transposase-like protein